MDAEGLPLVYAGHLPQGGYEIVTDGEWFNALEGLHTMDRSNSERKRC